MGNITLRIPDDLHEKLRRYKQIKWTQLIREFLEQKVKELEEVEYRLYSLKRIVREEGAENLFEF